MPSLEFSRARDFLLCGDLPAVGGAAVRRLFDGVTLARVRNPQWTIGPGPASSLPGQDPAERRVSAPLLGPATEVGVAETRRASPRRSDTAADELRSLFAQSRGYMAIVHGAEHVFELASPACCQLAGTTALAGRKVRDVLPSGCEKQVLDMLDHAFRSGEPVVQRELRLTFDDSPDAAVRYLDVECQPIHNRHGAVTGLFVQARDVTSQVTAIQSMQEAAQQKDDFLALLAHELRNPLSPILNVSSILRHLPAQGDTLTRLADTLSRQARHMRRLIDDLIDASSMRKGLLKLDWAEVDIREVIEAAVEQTSSPMKARGHELSVNLADCPMWVQGDSIRLVQVVANVLHNGAKYTPAGGKVTLRAAPVGKWLEIEVSDNGIGLDPEFLARAFEPFVQAERQPGRSETGLGLGLALVRSLVELHGGTVKAASPGLGLGSTFTLRLPLLQDHPDGDSAPS